MDVMVVWLKRIYVKPAVIVQKLWKQLAAHKHPSAGDFTTCVIDSMLCGTIAGNCLLNPPDSSRRLSWVTFFFFLISFEKPSCATKEKTRPDLLHDTLDIQLNVANMKSNLQMLSLSLSAVWSAGIKAAFGCHRAAQRLTTTWGICALLNHVCPGRLWQRRGRLIRTDQARIIGNCLFSNIFKSGPGWENKITVHALNYLTNQHQEHHWHVKVLLLFRSTEYHFLNGFRRL